MSTREVCRNQVVVHRDRFAWCFHVLVIDSVRDRLRGGSGRPGERSFNRSSRIGWRGCRSCIGLVAVVFCLGVSAAWSQTEQATDRPQSEQNRSGPVYAPLGQSGYKVPIPEVNMKRLFGKPPTAPPKPDSSAEPSGPPAPTPPDTEPARDAPTSPSAPAEPETTPQAMKPPPQRVVAPPRPTGPRPASPGSVLIAPAAPEEILEARSPQKAHLKRQDIPVIPRFSVVPTKSEPKHLAVESVQIETRSGADLTIPLQPRGEFATVELPAPEPKREPDPEPAERVVPPTQPAEEHVSAPIQESEPTRPAPAPVPVPVERREEPESLPPVANPEPVPPVAHPEPAPPVARPEEPTREAPLSPEPATVARPVRPIPVQEEPPKPPRVVVGKPTPPPAADHRSSPRPILETPTQPRTGQQPMVETPSRPKPVAAPSRPVVPSQSEPTPPLVATVPPEPEPPQDQPVAETPSAPDPPPSLPIVKAPAVPEPPPSPPIVKAQREPQPEPAQPPVAKVPPEPKPEAPKAAKPPRQAKPLPAPIARKPSTEKPQQDIPPAVERPPVQTEPSTVTVPPEPEPPRAEKPAPTPQGPQPDATPRPEPAQKTPPTVVASVPRQTPLPAEPTDEPVATSPVPDEPRLAVPPLPPPARPPVATPLDENAPRNREIRDYLRDTAPILEELSLLMMKAPTLAIEDYDPSEESAVTFPRDVFVKMEDMKRRLQILDSKTFAIIPPKRYGEFHSIVRESMTETFQACDAIIAYMNEPTPEHFQQIEGHLRKARELIRLTRAGRS